MKNYEKKYCCNDIEYSENELTQAIAFAAEILKDGIFYAENSGRAKKMLLDIVSKVLYAIEKTNSYAGDKEAVIFELCCSIAADNHITLNTAADWLKIGCKFNEEIAEAIGSL